jgi:hypothetical protein
MAFPLLGLLTSPIAKIGLGVVSKVVEGVKHKNELKSIQRNAELAAKQSIDYAEIEARKAVSKAEAEVRKAQADGMSKSFKDEFLVIFWCAVIAATFFEPTQPHMVKGWEILKQAPTEVWYVILTITAGSFGANTIAKWKK